MNKQQGDVLSFLLQEPFITQRVLAETTGYSLEAVNCSLKELIQMGYLNEELYPTLKARDELEINRPRRAIILAAGFGMRMVPINRETSKALLEVNGERLIERQIRQLHDVGIREIYIVVGFMKEQFEYLIDEFGVDLIVNPEYATKNNLHSLFLASDYLENAYIIPCDIWCDRNPFRCCEMYSWYMIGDLVEEESEVRVNRKMELIKVSTKAGGNTMIGICYLLPEDVKVLRSKIKEMAQDARYDGCFWEEALYDKDRMIITARIAHSATVVEINTYEQLRELDCDSQQLKSDALTVIAEQFNTTVNQITDIAVLKKGMTNRSFLFRCKGKKYIMRIPGEGTDQLINRRQEAAVYHALAGYGVCDNPVYIDSERGYKITEFLEGVRICDPSNVSDLRKCMERLRNFHNLKLQVKHEFDLFGQIEFYEKLRGEIPSVYKDYQTTKENVLSLRSYIDAHVTERSLTHIDAVPDNFLFYNRGEGEELQLTDWEYAGMQDPHMDVAMFCIYAMYNKRQIDRLIQIYFQGKCPVKIRTKIYCYIAAGGLLWSNWCEYKSTLGVEFGEYSLRQYRYAKDYYRIAREEMKKIENMGDGKDAEGR